MYWVKTFDGHLANLELAVAIWIKPPEKELGGRFEVRADVQSEEIILTVGNRKECGDFRDALLSALKERENKANSVDVILERT